MENLKIPLLTAFMVFLSVVERGYLNCVTELVLNNWLVWLLSFKQLLLSIDVPVCLSATLMLNILETTPFRGLYPIRTL